MQVIVYGTLKRGYGNNRILQDGDAEFIKEVTVEGYKLYNAGFPVAWPSAGESIKGELWDIKDNANTLRRLDGLEGEGFMYNRTAVTSTEQDGAEMYVGHPRVWHFKETEACPKDEQGRYFWERNW